VWDSIYKAKKKKEEEEEEAKAGVVAQAIESLPSKCEALGSNSNAADNELSKDSYDLWFLLG
jgi:hypothetical protein